MYCITCKPIVEKQLEHEKAVKRIDIDYMTDSVIVEFDSSLLTKDEIQIRRYFTWHLITGGNLKGPAKFQ